MAWDTGLAAVIPSIDGEAFWQPQPTGGHVSIKVRPGQNPSNLYTSGTQSIPVGGVLPERALRQSEILIYVMSGAGTADVDGRTHELVPGTTLYVGRLVPHKIVNTGDTNLDLFFVVWPPGLEDAMELVGRPRKARDELAPKFDADPGALDRMFPAVTVDPASASNGTEQGPVHVLAPDDGDSYWQPAPTDGYATIKLSPDNLASNHVTVVEQIVPPGKLLPPHGHPRNEELKMIRTGTAIATVDGVEHRVGPGDLCVTGRWVQHSFLNVGDDDLTIFAVFMPPALENLLSGIGRKRIPGEAAPEPFGLPDNIVEIVTESDLVIPDQIEEHNKAI